MLKKITLSHFRQHLDRTFEFGPGLNAIRGENEAGKTSVLEAFIYFCFGSRALRESLDDVVTYHQPVSRLRVDVEFEHLGVTYTGYRGKSGAELNFGREKVVGQNELTAFFEKLFKADAKLAGQLMFASQKSLAESLKAGPTAAGKMIEDLADFDLIDRVAEAIAKHRPTGRTDAAEARVATLQAQVDAGGVQEDLVPLRAEIATAQTEVQTAESQLFTLREQRAELDADAARDAVREHATRSRHIEELTFSIDEIDRELARPAVIGPTGEQLAAARAAVEAEKHAARAASLHAELQGVQSNQWDQDLASLEAEVVKVDGLLQQARGRYDDAVAELVQLDRERAEQKRSADVAVAQLEGRLIRETTCALCQKDLSDVPEVVQTNSSLGRQIADRKQALEAVLGEILQKCLAQESLRDLARTEMTDQAQYLKDLNAVLAYNGKVEQLYARAAEFIKVDRSVVPGLWRWTGPAATGGESAVSQLALLERRSYEAAEDAVRRDEKTKQRAGLVASRDADIAVRRKLDPDAAGRLLAQAQALDEQIKDAESKLKAQQLHLQTLESTLSTKEALAAQVARQLELVKQQLLDAQTELASMQRYNLLLKKVREARPVITNKLWNIVLGGVSKHLSEIRDQPSVVTRADGTFKVNGYPAAGLSGSAEDMLGLAMRIALTKTFLPGINMLQLDEPGAACSDARETRMLGMLATLGFGQIVMISHNVLVDAVADRIITV